MKQSFYISRYTVHVTGAGVTPASGYTVPHENRCTTATDLAEAKANLLTQAEESVFQDFKRDGWDGAGDRRAVVVGEIWESPALKSGGFGGYKTEGVTANDTFEFERVIETRAGETV